MHQSHNIPWHLLQENFKLTHHSNPVDPKTGRPCQPRPGVRHTVGYTLEPRKKPNQAGALNHFVRKLVATIEEFSRTERLKYPRDLTKDLPHPDSGPLVLDETWQQMTSLASLRFYNHQREAAELKHIENWIDKFEQPEGRLPEVAATVVKGLIATDEVEKVLMLVSHPHLNRDEIVRPDDAVSGPEGDRLLHVNALERICTVGQAYTYGWADLGWISLKLYILLNLIVALKAEYEDQHGPYWYRKLDKFRQVCWNLQAVRTWMRPPAANNTEDSDAADRNAGREGYESPHSALLLSGTEFEMNRANNIPLPSDPARIPSHSAAILQREEEVAQENDLLSDMQALHAYLSRLFRFMYITDMAMKECGRPMFWEVEAITSLTSLVTGLQSDWKWKGEECSVEFK